jgi:tetratricopeptide (TPR) repeat protein
MRFPGSVIPLLALHVTLTLAQTTGSQDAIRQATGDIQNGHFERAESTLRQAVNQHPSDVQLWNLLGIAETELHHSSQAQIAFQHGLKLDPDSVSLNENTGLFFFKEAAYPSAKRYLKRAVDLGSDKPGVAFSLAAARLRTGEHAQALKDFKRLEPELAKNSDYWKERGLAETDISLAAAASSFDHALSLDRRNPGALNGAATVAERQHLDEKALAFLIRAKQAAPDDPETLMHFGQVCLRRDLAVDALTALEKAHQIAPSNNAALYLAARANIAVEKWQRSYDLFSEFARRVPAFAPTYYALGWLDIKLNRLDEARAQLQHCLSLSPNYLDPQYELAQLDINDGQFAVAEPLLEAVLKRDPHHVKANVALADLLLRQRKLNEAEAHLNQAIKDDPKNGSAHYKLSMLYLRLHETEKGQKESALAKALNAEAKQAARTQLQIDMPPDSANPPE